MTWQASKAWSDRFLPQIRRILGECLIGVATNDEDQHENTDLITLRMPGEVRIACRIRRFTYLADYGDEFTLRCSRGSGRQTELSKLLTGWGDYLFYGFASDDESELAAWLVGDLAVFRDWIEQQRRDDGRLPLKVLRNGDGSSSFAVFSLSDLPDAFIVARHAPRLAQAA